MNLDFTPEENAFRQEVRAFIKENYPPELRAAQDSGAPLTQFLVDGDSFVPVERHVELTDRPPMNTLIGRPGS